MRARVCALCLRVCVVCVSVPRPRTPRGAYRASKHLPLQGSQQRGGVHRVLHQLQPTLDAAAPRRWEGPRWEEWRPWRRQYGCRARWRVQRWRLGLGRWQWRQLKCRQRAGRWVRIGMRRRRRWRSTDRCCAVRIVTNERKLGQKHRGGASRVARVARRSIKQHDDSKEHAGWRQRRNTDTVQHAVGLCCGRVDNGMQMIGGAIGRGVQLDGARPLP